MKRQVRFLGSALVVAIAVCLSAHVLMAQTTTSMVSAGAGSYEAGTTFEGVSLTGMRFGIGVDLPGAGIALGQVQFTLVGVSQEIVVEGEASTAVQDALGTIVISGLSTVDMGDGSPPMTGVAFAIDVDPSGPGALTVTVGATALPPLPPDLPVMLQTCVPPAEVATDLRFLNDQDMIWTAAPPTPGLSYNIYEGTAGGSEWQYNHVCLGPRSVTPTATAGPISGQPNTASYYLVSGNVACGTGTSGFSSAAVPRSTPPPCP